MNLPSTGASTAVNTTIPAFAARCASANSSASYNVTGATAGSTAWRCCSAVVLPPPCSPVISAIPRDALRKTGRRSWSIGTLASHPARCARGTTAAARGESPSPTRSAAPESDIYGIVTSRYLSDARKTPEASELITLAASGFAHGKSVGQRFVIREMPAEFRPLPAPSPVLREGAVVRVISNVESL
jgi:hypothetical protein